MDNILKKDFSRVFKASSVYGLGKLLTKLFSFFLIPLYTAYLTPEDYGILATVNIIGSIVLIICLMSFDGAFARYYYDYKENENTLKKYLGSLTIYILLFNLLIMSLLIIGKKIIFIPFLPKTEVNLYSYIILQLGIVYFSFVTILLLTFYQVQEKPIKYVILSLGQFFLSIGIIIYFVVVKKMGAYGSLLGNLLSTIFFFFISMSLFWKHIRINLYFPFIKNAYRFGIPVSIHLLCSWLLGYSDRLILLKYVSLSELGIYYFALQIALVMYFVIESINLAWVPFFFDTIKNRKDALSVLSKIIHYYYVGIFVIALAGILFYKEILTLFANERYYSSFGYIPFLILSYLFTSFYFMNINTLYYFKKTKIIPLITLSAALVKIILSFLLIPNFSLWGAVFSTIIATIFWSISVYYFANKLFKIPYRFNSLLKLCAILLIISIISFNLNIGSFVFSIIFKIGLFLFFILLIEKANIIKLNQFISLIPLFNRAK